MVIHIGRKKNAIFSGKNNIIIQLNIVISKFKDFPDEINIYLTVFTFNFSTFYIIISQMCYLRHLHIEERDCSILQKQYFQQSSQAFSQNNSFNSLPIIPIVLPKISFSNMSCLSQLLKTIQANSKLISSIQNKINQNYEEQIKEINQMEEERKISENVDELPQKVFKDETIIRLFEKLIPNYGENSFKFKLSLSENLPNILYKNRKIKINVKLLPCTARSNKIVYNSNPLQICIGIFDKDGNWVGQNTHGEAIINGQTQVNLYEGKAEFSRLLFNQINGNMPKEKLNIAIYVKPQTVLYEDNHKNIGNSVSWLSIKPLILKNVQILSKKRKKIQEDEQ